MSGGKSLAQGEGCWLFATGSNGGDLDIFNIYRRRRQYFIPSLGLPQRPRQSDVCPSHLSGVPGSAEGTFSTSGCLPLDPTAGIWITLPSSPRLLLVSFLIVNRRRCHFPVPSLGIPQHPRALCVCPRYVPLDP